MSSAPLKIAIEQGQRGIATLTLNRPEKSNALDPDTVATLTAAIARLDEDASVRVLVLRGAGKHFCAGADAAASSGGWAPSGPSISDLCRRLDQCSKPTVAVVHGACVGGGLALAACCDIMLADSTAFFAIPEVRLGVAPGPLTLFFMQVLPARALRRYAISGERFLAEQALALGLVHRLTSPDTLDAALAEIIEALLQGGPQAIADAKHILRECSGRTPTDETLRAMDADFRRRGQTPEALEGLASFREKRRPRWYS